MRRVAKQAGDDELAKQDGASFLEVRTARHPGPISRAAETMNLLAQALFIARIEAGFFVRFPKLLLATLFVTLIPVFYAVIYLSSVWDPAAKTGFLPVGLVNLDQGLSYRNQYFNMGHEVLSKLQTGNMFGYHLLQDEQEARQQVRQGKLAFALFIPRDFSSNAVPGAEVGIGKLVIYTSAGNNYESASLAKQFASSLARDVNQSLNEQRWAMVLTSAAGSTDSLGRLRKGVNQLRAGAKELSQGADKTAIGATALIASANHLDDGVGQLTNGVKQLGIGLKSMDARIPPNSDLQRLNSGVESLVAGHGELNQGISALKSGSQRLKEGVTAFSAEAKDAVFVPAKVVEGLDQVVDGASQLDAGIQSARDAQARLGVGATQLGSGVTTLTSGMRALGSGIHTAVARLPEDAQLEQLASGAVKLTGGTAALAEATHKVKDGSFQLALGIETLAASIPLSVQALDGSAQGLAQSVETVVELDAVVENHGSGFAPNILPGALWLGAGIVAFLIHVKVLPEPARDFSSLAQLAGKVAIPALLVLAQAALLLLTVLFILKIQVSRPGPFALTLAVASLTFLMIVFALTRAFGDAGKALAMIFLALQVSASGGILPVELSGSLFETISPWLPITWVVKGIKASMFGAYEGQWLIPLVWVALAGGLASLFAATLGRWRYVNPELIRPAVDF
jgi:putative membrane protein